MARLERHGGVRSGGLSSGRGGERTGLDAMTVVPTCRCVGGKCCMPHRMVVTSTLLSPTFLDFSFLLRKPMLRPVDDLDPHIYLYLSCAPRSS